MPSDRRTELERELSLAELVNRVLDRGAVVQGDIVIGVAGVDLIHLGLRVVLAAVETEASPPGAARAVTDARIRALLEE